MGATWHHKGCRFLDKDLAPEMVPDDTFYSNSAVVHAESDGQTTGLPMHGPKYLDFPAFILILFIIKGKSEKK